MSILLDVQFDNIAEPTSDDSKRDALLQAAVGVFARYGFRKTSMDEVARAAGISRQGLYLRFADKEALFRKAVEYKLNNQLTAATAALSNHVTSLESRLICACDEWAGRYVGISGADAADLMCASTSMAGATLLQYESQFEHALAASITSSPLADCCVAVDTTPEDVAAVLHATARGLKQVSRSRQQFVLGITAAVRMICAPLRTPPFNRKS